MELSPDVVHGTHKTGPNQTLVLFHIPYIEIIFYCFHLFSLHLFNKIWMLRMPCVLQNCWKTQEKPQVSNTALFPSNFAHKTNKAKPSFEGTASNTVT